MLRKILIALLVAVLTSAQAAAEDVDWSRAQRIATKAEFARYIESERRKGNTTFHVILTNGLKVDTAEDFARLAPTTYVGINGTWHGLGNERVAQITYRITEYPGTRVANAYLSGNTDKLNVDERELYDKAVEIVNEVKKYSSPFYREVCIHNIICDCVNYVQGKNTALSALVYGQADCDGYADAFYMLGRMCGLEVGRVMGGGHAWNTIEFNGKIYFVDVTNDRGCFDFKEYGGKRRGFIYFNAPEEIMQVNNTWDREVFPNAQRTVDNLYAYRILDSHAQVDNLQEGWKFIADKLSEPNRSFVSVMVPSDKMQDGGYQGRPIAHHTLGFGKYHFVTAIPR